MKARPKPVSRQGFVQSKLPIFVAADNLSPFITKELRENCNEMIFRTTSGSLAIGYRAELLTEVCVLFLTADSERALRKNQKHTGVTDRQWTMEDVVCMMDEYQAAKLNSQFEAAFAERVTHRTHPKSYTPTPRANIPLPWYLDPESNGAPESDEKP